ncbi:FRIGIDA-like protein 3 [Iris pallida]|uniref:FRIGIDA-like protein n=1 Tax=Iris pallida TaxID=29817 RepID=A0AAX6GXR1_IRIPA|nr:FRIGIDA-like protein 3 [Iris pallida]
MAEFEKIAKSTKEMLEQLEKAFEELRSHKDLYTKHRTKWEDVKKYFHNLETSLKCKLTKVKEKETALEEQQSAAHESIGAREAAVAAKEVELLDRLQELKDSAVSAILEARKNCKATAPVLADIKGRKHDEVRAATEDLNAPSPASGDDVPYNKSDHPSELLPNLRELCKQMDAKGLLEFLSEHKKNLDTITEELSVALASASEPTRLVLDSLEGFYPQDSSNSQGTDKPALQLLRKACFVVLEAAAPLLGLADPGDCHPMSSKIKQQAKAIADQWKAKLMAEANAPNGYSLEVIAFLQLLVTFSIAEEFDIDELWKLALSISRHSEAPGLCRSLGLTEKMPGYVEALVHSARPIDAVHFAHAFQLTESFPPVPLLKQYLEQTIDSTTTLSDQGFNKKELRVLRVVIKCIEEYKLQEHYPVEPLKKRVAQLEKAKYNRKRMGQAVHPQAKKPRANGRYAARKPSTVVDNRQLPPPVYYKRGLNPQLAERYPERYPYTVPHTYEFAGPAYGQQPSSERPYHYPDERVAPPVPYSSLSNYGNYDGAGFQSSTRSNYENYMGAGAQSASSYYGSYMGTGVQPPNQSAM